MNIQDSNMLTPLLRACERGNTEAVVMLLNGGASVELRDSIGRTCLHWAASGGYTTVCSALFHQGLPVDVLDQGGWVWCFIGDACWLEKISNRRTPLHCAAYGGFSECVTVLLELGADVNRQDYEGISALHWACSAGHLDTVQLLLSTGAVPNLMEANGDRLTCLDYAIIGNHQEIAQLLIEQGALSASGIHDLAAVIIQRHVRGHLVRRKAAVLREQRRQLSSPQPLPPSSPGSSPSPPTHTPIQPQAPKPEAVKLEAVIMTKAGHRK